MAQNNKKHLNAENISSLQGVSRNKTDFGKFASSPCDCNFLWTVYL